MHVEVGREQQRHQCDPERGEAVSRVRDAVTVVGDYKHVGMRARRKQTQLFDTERR